MLDTVLSLIMRSLREPRQVARWLVDLQLSREALLTALALVVAVNTILFSLSILGVPGPLPVFLSSPGVFAALQGVSVLGTMVALQLAGRMLGGTARFADIAILVIWMQGLRAVVQLVLLLMMPISGFLGGLVLIFATVAGVMILLNFLDEAHGLGGLGKAFLVLALAVVGMVLALSVLLTLIGVDPNGMNRYV